jgi:hypothetical protein
MFGSTRDYGLRPGGYGANPYTAPGLFSSGYSGFMGGLGGLNPFGRRSNAYLYGARSSGAAGGFTWTAILGYFLSIITMLLIILLLVHYFIRPVFQFNPGGPGFIPVPGMNDSEVFWKPGTTAAPIKTTDIALGTKSTNYSLTLDILIKNPQALGTTNRVFFSRGENSPEPDAGQKGKTLASQTLSVALLPTTTDMVITLININNNEEPLVIRNVPVLTPFRLGIIIMEGAMEVYVNGRLLKTRKLDASPKEGGAFFYPPQASMAQVVRVNNLIIWDKTLTAPEIRYATPALMTVSDTDLTSLLPNGSVCGVDITKDATDLVNKTLNQGVDTTEITDTIKNLPDTGVDDIQNQAEKAADSINKFF